MPIARRSSRAQDDIDGIASYIAERNPTAARQFIAAVEKTIQLIGATPDIGARYPHPNYPRLRAHLILPQFRNYVVFYESTDAGVLIVRVLHGHRDIPTVLDHD